MNYKYMRVSTDKQDVKRQEMLLKDYPEDKVFIDKLTGKNTDRPQLNQLRLEAGDGDNIYIESISRLGRNVDDLRALCEEFRSKGATVHFIKEGLTTKGDTYKFLLTILGAVAEMERETTQQRVIEGVRKAQQYGTKSGRPIGRPPAKIPSSFKRYYTQWKDGDITAVEFAKLLQVSRTTLYRYINQHEQTQLDGKLKEEKQVDGKGKPYKQVKL